MYNDMHTQTTFSWVYIDVVFLNEHGLVEIPRVHLQGSVRLSSSLRIHGPSGPKQYVPTRKLT